MVFIFCICLFLNLDKIILSRVMMKIIDDIVKNINRFYLGAYEGSLLGGVRRGRGWVYFFL